MIDVGALIYTLLITPCQAVLVYEAGRVFGLIPGRNQ